MRFVNLPLETMKLNRDTKENFGVSLPKQLRSYLSLILISYYCFANKSSLFRLNRVFFFLKIQDHKRVADMEAYSICCNAIEDMGKKLWALPCSRDANSSDIIKVPSST